MHSLARADQSRCIRLIHSSHSISKDARGVDHDLCFHLKLKACLLIAKQHASDLASLFHQPMAADVIEQNPALLSSSLGQVYRQSGVIELPIVINDTSTQAFRLQIGDHFQDILSR